MRICFDGYLAPCACDPGAISLLARGGGAGNELAAGWGGRDVASTGSPGGWFVRQAAGQH